ncbi:MAG: hypothetical protein ACTSSK_18005, partial [Candidatus Heimdallarchaeota archaeon]
SLVERFEEKMNRFKDLKEETGKILLDFNLNEDQIKAFAEKNYPKTVKAIDKEIEKLDKEGIELNREIGKAEGAEEVREESVKAFAAKEDKVKHYMKIAKLIIQSAEETTKKLREEYTAKVKNTAENIWNQYKGEPWSIEWDSQLNGIKILFLLLNR